MRAWVLESVSKDIRDIEELDWNPFRTVEGYKELDEIIGDPEEFLKRNKQLKFVYEEDYGEFLDEIDVRIRDDIPLLDHQQQRLANYISDKEWRICSGTIYKVKNKSGETIPFVPTREQYHFLNNYHNFNVILKARQLGFTTLIAIMLLDDALFMEWQSVGIIAHKREAAYDILDKKIREVYLQIPKLFRLAEAGGIEVRGKDNSSTIEFSNGSRITASTSFRSGTLTHLHVSELGKIASKDPLRAEEIFTWAFPAVVWSGYKFIESTAEWQSGRFYDLVNRARELEWMWKNLSAKEPKFFFYPWWKNEGYRSYDEDVELEESTLLYGIELEEKYGLNLVLDSVDYERLDKERKSRAITLEQLRWYQLEKSIQGVYMKREYPSHPDEAFESTLIGAFFKEEIEAVRRGIRIKRVEYDSTLPLYLVLDIGFTDPTSMIFFQATPDLDINAGLGQVRVLQWYHVEQYDFQKLDLEIIKPIVRQNGWKVPLWFMPHDAKKSSQVDGLQGHKFIKSLGYQVRVLQKAGDKADLIWLWKKIFPFCVFDESGIIGKNRFDERIDLLTMLWWYREQISKITWFGTWVPMSNGDPEHAWDAWCYLGQACTILSKENQKKPEDTVVISTDYTKIKWNDLINL